jgi:hypothetical protein
MRVFAADDAHVAAAAQRGDEEALERALEFTAVEEDQVLVPCGSHLLLRDSAVGGLGFDRLLQVPARSCAVTVELDYVPMPSAELLVRVRFADGAVPDEFECNVRGDAATRQTEVLEHAPGLHRVRCGVGEMVIDVTAYPSWLDDGFEQRRTTTVVDGRHEVDVVLQRRGRVAFTLRDAAEPDRVADDALDGVVAAGELELERFTYHDGEYEVTSSQPPLGRRIECLTLLPVGKQELRFAFEGFAPTTAVADVREQEMAELTVWLQRRD